MRSSLKDQNANNEASRKDLIYIGVEPRWTLFNFASTFFISDEQRAFESTKKQVSDLPGSVIYFVSFT